MSGRNTRGVILKLPGLKSKWICSLLRYRSLRANRKLTACPITVARAAPRGPIPIGHTKRISSTMLITEAIAMKIKGCFESPMPRRMADTRLYP